MVKHPCVCVWVILYHSQTHTPPRCAAPVRSGGRGHSAAPAHYTHNFHTHNLSQNQRKQKSKVTHFNGLLSPFILFLFIFLTFAPVAGKVATGVSSLAELIMKKSAALQPSIGLISYQTAKWQLDKHRDYNHHRYHWSCMRQYCF